MTDTEKVISIHESFGNLFAGVKPGDSAEIASDGVIIAKLTVAESDGNTVSFTERFPRSVCAGCVVRFTPK